jgi:hypothetical protein
MKCRAGARRQCGGAAFRFEFRNRKQERGGASSATIRLELDNAAIFGRHHEEY